LNRREEHILIKGCQNGDSECQERLFFLHSELLFATCKRYLNNHEDAEDALQDSFIKIYKSLSRFDISKGTLKNWMITICVNNCLNRLNRKKHKMSLDQIVEITSNYDTESDLNFQELFQIIMDLPVPYRTVVNLYMVEGYSHKEIGEMMNVKDSSSRSILTRAKKMLQQKIIVNKKKESWQT
jgi:RNA polymerase sigma-70 factor (ECF subfamily)